MLEEAPKRKTVLNCHISEENKEWLAKLSEKLNRPMGDLVDEILTHTKKEARKK